MRENKIIIFDTTLRDGEQALRASLSVKEKLQLALALESLGVDVMEVGFPVSSQGDFNSVESIAKIIKNSTVCALSRAVQKDIQIAAEALKMAKNPRIHTFIATSNLHVQTKLKKTFEDVLQMCEMAVKLARNYTDDVEFSCEDAGRTGIDNICKIVQTAIDAGAKTVNIPDTVGYCLPDEYANIISEVKNRVPNIDKAVISVHCHNDLGMGVANSLSAIKAGARQIECTINGIGERAGNSALEEIVMAIKTRQDIFCGLDTKIDTKQIHKVSQLVSNICHMPIASNKAIVGANAFVHSSGIHQDGMVKNKATYEILSPESIGLKNEKLNLTARSGRAAVKNHMDFMGYKEGKDYILDKLYGDFLALADKKGQIFDYDLEALAFMGMCEDSSDRLKLDTITSQTLSHLPASCFVQLSLDDEKISAVSNGGNGPVDAVFSAILKILDLQIKVISYNLSAKGEGASALGQVDLVVEFEGRRFHGLGLETDILESSAKALINAINAIYRSQKVQNIKQIKEKK